MPRHPRAATPLPTVPPPNDDPPGTPLLKRLQTWQALVMIALVLLGAGATAVTWAAGKANVAELHQVRDSAAAALSSAQAGEGAQLGALQAQVQDLRTHQAAIDTSLRDLTRTTDRLDTNVDRIFDQLLEVARVTGARQLPAPRPPQKGHPP